MSDARSVGRAFEDEAASYLLGVGFTLLGRRVSLRGGELDLVALDGETLVFIEVKGSRTAKIRPEENVTADKRTALLRAAERYCAEFGIKDRALRFDVIAIDADGLRHYRDAFERVSFEEAVGEEEEE